MTRLFVLLASFNRCDKTLECLRTLYLNANLLPEMKVVVFDDNSTDDTVLNVKNEFPNAIVLNGDGNNYWCRSMVAAFDCIKEELGDGDYLLCLNDDVSLDELAVSALITQHTKSFENGYGVIAGSCVDKSGRRTYGGLRREGNIKFSLIESENQLALTMNFNVVLIGANVLKKNGFLNPIFEHAMGDIEYGIRLSLNHVPIITSSRIVGLCESNDMSKTFNGKNALDRLKICLGKKYFPVRSWYYFTKNIAGPFWILYFIYPYAKYTFMYRNHGH